MAVPKDKRAFTLIEPKAIHIQCISPHNSRISSNIILAYGLVFFLVLSYYIYGMYPFVVRRPDTIDNFAAKLQNP